MALPLCVKCDANDVVSLRALTMEGWRYIGQLNTYEGDVFGADEGVRRVRTPAEPPVSLASDISWSGRLWRDKAVSQSEAWAETERLLTEEDLTCYVIGKAPAAFGLFTRPRVVLIGVHPAAQGLGLAQGLIRHAARGRQITAGTYSDNEAAIALYKSLGMSLIKSQAVFHK